jgi:xylose dehydrogenase (NAD/NADP)
MKKVRWGLLSTARINRRVIPAMRASTTAELVAVASRSAESAAAYAAEWQIPLSFGGYRAMLESGAIDAVYISLPNHLHAEWSIAALEAGVHVLCEKPLALSLAEVDAMTAASQANGRALAEAFMYRHHPQTRTVGEIVRSGELGAITLVRGVFNFAIDSRDNVRLVPEYGGGCLWDVGVYPLSFAQFVLGGAPQWVAGACWLGPSGVDEAFSGLMVYPGGAQALISASFRTPFHTEVEIIGTSGRLLLNRPFIGLDEARLLLFGAASDPPQEISVPTQELYLGEIEDLNAAVLHGSAPYLNLAESRNHIRTALALHASARSNRVVQLE